MDWKIRRLGPTAGSPAPAEGQPGRVRNTREAVLGTVLPREHFQLCLEIVGFRTSMVYLAEVSAIGMSSPMAGRESGYPGLGGRPWFEAKPPAAFFSSLFQLDLKVFVSRELSGSELWYFCLGQPLPCLQVSGKASIWCVTKG